MENFLEVNLIASSYYNKHGVNAGRKHSRLHLSKTLDMSEEDKIK